MYDITCKLTHFCDKFSDNVEILELSLDNEHYFKCIHQILTKGCTNLKELQIYCQINPNLYNLLLKSLPPKPKLTSFVLNSASETPIHVLQNFAQIVISASPNLKEVTFTWGIYPDFKNSKFLSYLTISLDNLDAAEIGRFDPADLSRVLYQVGGELVSLCFGEYDRRKSISGSKTWIRKEFRLPRKMPKLKKYRNLLIDVFQCDDVFQDFEKMPALKTLVIGQTESTNSARLHEILQAIVTAGKILGNVKTLKIFEIHDAILFAGLKTAFPNLERFEVDTYNIEDDRGEESGMKLGVVLNTCGGWRRLKHLKLGLPMYPKEAKDFLQPVLDCLKLCKELKTLRMLTYYWFICPSDLTEFEMDLFKQLLLALDGMDEVEIQNFYCTHKSARDMWKLIDSKKMWRFKIFQQIPNKNRFEF
ncbi:uncharacterized protein LOC118433324 [Folsomia candida]|nr:uncharacterized protein LOC118433324 [Folsomia candida]